VKSGPAQNLHGSDGIIDIAHTIDEENVDHYPLTVPYGTPLPLMWSLKVRATPGGMTDPTSGDYNYIDLAQIQCTAIQGSYHFFDHWELDGINMGSDNKYMILMNKNYILRAIFLGDPNKDGVINLLDLLFASKAFGTYQGSSDYIVSADMNCDGKINLLDMILIATHLGRGVP
jgi:hypothetical protein